MIHSNEADISNHDQLVPPVQLARVGGRRAKDEGLDEDIFQVGVASTLDHDSQWSTPKAVQLEKQRCIRLMSSTYSIVDTLTANHTSC